MEVWLAAMKPPGVDNAGRHGLTSSLWLAALAGPHKKQDRWELGQAGEPVLSLPAVLSSGGMLLMH